MESHTVHAMPATPHSVPRTSSPEKVIIPSTLCQHLHIQSPERPAHGKSYCPCYASNSTFSPQNVQPTESLYAVYTIPATPHSVPRTSSAQQVIILTMLSQKLHIFQMLIDPCIIISFRNDGWTRNCGGDRGSTVVKVLRYKLEGRWFDCRWCHWIFLLT
jgi:hypothetical protein